MSLRSALTGITLLILGAAIIVAVGLLFGHDRPIRVGLSIALLATFPLIERILD